MACYKKYFGKGIQAYAIGLDINGFLKEYKAHNKNYGDNAP